jgi:beta-1,4-mannosyl-glycoprotein beta-1,4-N-acetylglucosaminyltransferase
MFYNELDVLEVRLKELYDHVDHIVISEASTTFSGHSKDYIFLDNQERFKPFLDKVIHVKVEDMPGVVPGAPDGMACMYNENHQRNVLTRGLTDADDNDIILICDMDEILRGSVVDQLRADTQHTLWGFNMPYFYYKFNYMQVDPLIYQVNPSAATWGRAKTYPTFSIIRTHGMIWGNHPMYFDDGTNMKVQHSGWHFTYQGDTEFAANKLLTTGHDDYRHMAENVSVDALIAQGRSAPQLPWHKGEIVRLDDYFPKCITEDKERWKDYILPDGPNSVMDKLKVLFS